MSLLGDIIKTADRLRATPDLRSNRLAFMVSPEEWGALVDGMFPGTDPVRFEIYGMRIIKALPSGASEAATNAPGGRDE